MSGERSRARPAREKCSGAQSTHSQTWVSSRIFRCPLERGLDVGGKWRGEVIGDPDAPLVDAENLIHPPSRGHRHQPRDGTASLGDHDLFAFRDACEQLGKVCLGLVDSRSSTCHHGRLSTGPSKLGVDGTGRLILLASRVMSEITSAVRADFSPGGKLRAGINYGNFMAVQQSIGVPKGRGAGLAYLRGFVEDAKASGLVARAIEKTGARGVSVAARAPISS